MCRSLLLALPLAFAGCEPWKDACFLAEDYLEAITAQDDRGYTFELAGCRNYRSREAEGTASIEVLGYLLDEDGARVVDEGVLFQCELIRFDQGWDVVSCT